MSRMDKRAEIIVEGRPGETQGEDFRCCPLGVQFYSRRDISLYQMMELHLNFPAGSEENGTFDATGIVVQSVYDEKRKLHRLWIMFTDLSDSAVAKLRCVSKESGTQCPHCVNY